MPKTCRFDSFGAASSLLLRLAAVQIRWTISTNNNKDGISKQKECVDFVQSTFLLPFVHAVQ